MKFSVLICTYNRHELLHKALRSLVEGTDEKPDQIVVVNGGDEQADAVVNQFMGRPGLEVKLIKTVNKNLAASRNIGLPHCTGEIIAMTDDDAEVFPDWVTRIKQAHVDHPEAGAVGGPVLGINSHTLVGKVADLITFPTWPESCYVRTLPGVNIAYKREVINQVGLQDVTLFRGEDVDFNWRIKQLGYEVYFDPGVKVYHHHRPTARSLINQHYMYGRAYVLVRRKWLDMYCIYPHGIKRFYDILKAGHFFVGALYQPLMISGQLSTLKKKLQALPLLYAIGVGWRCGMVVQGWFEFAGKHSKSLQDPTSKLSS